MEEVKQRYFLVTGLVNRDWSIPSRVADVEFTYLQLRKILELIALGSLVVNASLYNKSKRELQKQWNAERIVKILDKINPDFYPVPVRIDDVGSLEGYQKLVVFEGDFLTKNDFIALYNVCASAMHAENPFKAVTYYAGLRDGIASWLIKIRNLLSVHHVRPVGSLCFCLIEMGAEDEEVTTQLFRQTQKE